MRVQIDFFFCLLMDGKRKRVAAERVRAVLGKGLGECCRRPVRLSVPNQLKR